VTALRARPLTARGLKAILTRAGVSHSALEIRDDPAVWTNVETGERSTSVVVGGPKELRRQASGVLYAKGLSNARIRSTTCGHARVAESAPVALV
jgi:hypothetical protein